MEESGEPCTVVFAFIVTETVSAYVCVWGGGGDFTLSTEKGMYMDFVTILRGASMQYITKLTTSQSQKPGPHSVKL